MSQWSSAASMASRSAAPSTMSVSSSFRASPDRTTTIPQLASAGIGYRDSQSRWHIALGKWSKLELETCSL